MEARAMRYLFRLGATCTLIGAVMTMPTGLAAPPSVVGTTSQAQLAAEIDTQIDQPRFASASWGISVVSLDNGHTLYAHDADRLLQPASTAKLYTAAFVLDTLGPDYRIPTQLIAIGSVEQGRLNGSLMLRGMGDPTLGTPGTNSDWADQLATQLAANGIHEVHGELIADDSYFEGPPIGSGWEARDLQSWFAVPASALSVQENVVDLTVSPTSMGGTAALTFDPSGSMPHVVNRIVTGTRNDVNLYRAPGDSTLYAFGTIAQRSEPQNFKLAIVDPASFAGTLLREALSRRGVHVNGPLRVQHWPQEKAVDPDNGTVVAQVLSPTAMEVLSRGLKRSQNLYLQNLLQIAGVKQKAAAEQAGDPDAGFLSSEAWGTRAMHELLNHIGISPDTAQLEEGAGLSRQDLATPNAMVRLLTYLASQPYGNDLRDALPSAGVDGTLEFRMRDTPAMGNVHAKTGSMTYVRCMVGYVTTASGEHLAFAIMLNNYVQDADEPSPSRNLDAIVELLAAYQGHG
jgi:D-alanyl-D-alanine carboxypeptidase/D-alanyl-D-alanine-endopeptidase (penicillin-binding protein 4)